MKVWNAYSRRLRSIVLVQNKIAHCQYLGMFTPSSCLKKELLEDPSSTKPDLNLTQKFQQNLVCYSPSYELTGVTADDVDSIENKLAFEESIPTNIHISRVQA